MFPDIGVVAVFRYLASLREEGKDFSEGHLHYFFSGLFSRTSWYAALLVYGSGGPIYGYEVSSTTRP